MNNITLGEIKKAKEIGHKGHTRYIWHACIDCGKERWVQLVSDSPKSLRCKSCDNKRRCGKFHPRWKGRVRKHGAGYMAIPLQPSDFFYPMADKNHYVSEHRLVVAKALGRCLHSWEIVHHKHAQYPSGSIEDKQDNRYPENLQLVSDDRHKQITILENKIKHLEKRIAILEAEIILLREQSEVVIG